MTRPSEAGPVAEADFSVPAIVCEGCGEKIRAALTALPGVHEVKVGLWRKRVRVRYEPGRVGASRLEEAIAEAGFVVADAAERG